LSIVEIGVYKGKRSKELIEVARIFNNNVNYYGFDLFDNLKKNGVRIDKDMVGKAAPTLAKAFRGIAQKQLGSMWIDK
jgi:hypothetical protein